MKSFICLVIVGPIILYIWDWFLFKRNRFVSYKDYYEIKQRIKKHT